MFLAQDAGLLALPILLLCYLALVVLLAAFGKSEFEFRVAAFPVHAQWHERIAPPLDGTR